MRCHVEQDWIANALKVWFYEPGGESGGARQLMFESSGVFRWEEFDRHVARPEPSLVLPMDTLELLMAEAGNFLPPSAATDRHLNDAIAMRDRLLALVEKRK